MKLNELRDQALDIATRHGFTESTPGEELMLMVTELAEAMEDIRNGKPVNEMTYNEARGGKPEGVPSEIADVIIRALHFSGKHGIDIEKAVTEKMKYNESRPYRHGKKM